MANQATPAIQIKDSNVGIGTASPGYKLETIGNARISGNLSINTTYNGFAANIEGTVYVIGASVWVNDGYGYANASSSTGMFPDSSHNITFKSNNSTKVYINAAGNVGINTTSPIVKLTVNNGVARTNTTPTYSSYIHTNDIDDYRFGLATIIKGGTTSADRYVALEASSYQVSTNTFGGGVDLILSPNGGNVGIGTTAPGEHLSIEGSGSQSLSIYSTDTGVSGTPKTFIKLYGESAAALQRLQGQISVAPGVNTNSGDMILSTANTAAAITERMRIDGTGNVNISGTSTKLQWYRTSDNVAGIVYLTKTQTIGSNGEAKLHGYDGIIFTTQGAETEKMRIASDGAIKFNSYDSTNNTGTPTYMLGTDASGNVVKTNTSNTPVGSNIYTLPSTTGAAAWKLLGRFTANNGGQSIFIKMVTNAGYNSNIDQNTEVYIRFKTSNGGSVDANGFSGDSSFYTIGAYSGYPGGNIKWVANAAGSSASSYELYVNMPNYSGNGGFYSVENTVGTWTPLNNAATDPGAASSTIMIPVKQFKVGGSDLVVGAGGADSYFGNGNVGIGTTAPQRLLHVNNPNTGGGADGSIKISNATVGSGTLDGVDLTINTSGEFYITNRENGPTIFETNGAERMRITSAGNVSIGNTNDTYKLDVTGDARFGDGNNFNPLIQYAGSGRVAASPGYSFVGDLDTGMFNPNLGNTLAFATGASERMRINSSGEVLVNVTSNQTESPLTSRNNGSSIEFGHLNTNSGYYGTVGSMYNNGTPFISFSCDSSITSAGNNFATRGFKGNVIHGDTGGNLIFSQATNANSASQSLTERIRITSDGNVGIGTISPDALLEISGNAGADPGPITNPTTFRITDAGNAATGLGDTTNDWGKIEFYSEDQSSSGPSVQAQIGTIYDNIYSTASNLAFKTRTSPITALTERLRIKPSGALSFYAYGSANNTGTPTYLLGTDASGNVVKTNTVPGSAAGPYLPLTGGTLTGDLIIESALLSNQENTDVDTGTETVANIAIATYTAAFFDFVIKKTTNVRSGTVYACHDGTNVVYTETSTNDLGDTSDVTLSVDISGGNMRLLATTTSNDWSVKSLIRAI